MAGHDTNRDAQTGCTVLLCDRPALAVADVRGGAPGTRETDLLAPGRLVRRVDGILLTGGSAFGLAAADGVMRYLAERNRGVKTGTRPVPIVPSAVIYDLGVGAPIAPDASSGRTACERAGPIDQLARGQVGVGTGATTDKIDGPDGMQRGGFGIGSWSWSEGTVTALAVVNAFGRVMRSGAREASRDDPLPGLFERTWPDHDGRESTTLAIILVDAPVDYSTLVLCSIAAHDAFARMIRPCHTIFDGDAAFAVALREASNVPPGAALKMAAAAVLAVERAILDAVTAVA
ncbi:MAG TPA: P1 family peptidase [Thermomicrobiales bacterium]|nr:P1 family peptidase [Thermomicrobiales bacterium]